MPSVFLRHTLTPASQVHGAQATTFLSLFPAFSLFFPPPTTPPAFSALSGRYLPGASKVKIWCLVLAMVSWTRPGPCPHEGFPDGASGKEPACLCGDLRDPAWPRGGMATYSSSFALENPNGQRSLPGYGPLVEKSQTRVKDLALMPSLLKSRLRSAVFRAWWRSLWGVVVWALWGFSMRFAEASKS